MFGKSWGYTAAWMAADCLFQPYICCTCTILEMVIVDLFLMLVGTNSNMVFLLGSASRLEYSTWETIGEQQSAPAMTFQTITFL